MSRWSACKIKRACLTSSVKLTRPAVSFGPSLEGKLTQLRQRHGDGVNGCVMHKTRDTGARADVGARDAGHWDTACRTVGHELSKSAGWNLVSLPAQHALCYTLGSWPPLREVKP